VGCPRTLRHGVGYLPSVGEHADLAPCLWVCDSVRIELLLGMKASLSPEPIGAAAGVSRVEPQGVTTKDLRSGTAPLGAEFLLKYEESNVSGFRMPKWSCTGERTEFTRRHLARSETMKQ
jgi:hypothetical protein